MRILEVWFSISSKIYWIFKKKYHKIQEYKNLEFWREVQSVDKIESEKQRNDIKAV